MVPAVLTACVLLAGCTTEAPAPGTETTSVAPDSAAADLVRAAAEATKKLASAHVVVAIHGKFDRLGPVTKADADVQSSPLTANGNVTYDTGVVAPFVLENDRVSVRLMNEWSEVGTVSDFIPSAMIDPGKGLPTLLQNILPTVQLDGSEKVGDMDTKKVVGSLSADQVSAVVPEAGSPADFTAWIRDGADPVLVRAILTVDPQRSLDVTLSNWNVPVKLTPAPTS